MPNWCDNYIKIKGKREEIIKCIEGIKGKKAIYKDECVGKENLFENYTFNATVEVQEEVLEIGYNKAGYYWQKKNWGCKWDMLYESKYELDRILEQLTLINKNDTTEVEFFVISPWNPVKQWVKALSEKHRNLDFELRFEVTEELLKGKMSFKGVKELIVR
ncbi:hypothetical protein [Clostridium perfringens]|uniref:DUF1281 family ferredoxin-like fold protein n=1 Tax=Clostridium perfringens TaxID=1502 RepID=UPI001DDB0748|nr:hypothetical protein [Clostridium perfringens]EHK2345478.1 hypothetical protein [Clostridium perfringens]MCX0352849.1 hypothetical protein [Clostridium perfringens]MDU4761917.1 hypothetical protein [Clostridium perfringens]